MCFFCAWCKVPFCPPFRFPSCAEALKKKIKHQNPRNLTKILEKVSKVKEVGLLGSIVCLPFFRSPCSSQIKFLIKKNPTNKTSLHQSLIPWKCFLLPKKFSKFFPWFRNKIMFFGLVQIGSLIFSCVCLLDFWQLKQFVAFSWFCIGNIEIPRKPRYTLCFSSCKLVVVVESKGLSYTNMFKQFHFVGFKRFLRKIVETNKNKKIIWNEKMHVIVQCIHSGPSTNSQIQLIFMVFRLLPEKKTKNAGLNCLNSFKPAKVVGDSLPQG